MFEISHLQEIRKEMKKDGLKAYLIFTSDPHASEYVADAFLSIRKYFCPFSGSAGEVLITLDNAYLFTDGRYWIQAQRELENSTITLVRVGDTNVLDYPEFIKANNLAPIGSSLMMLSKNINDKFKNMGINLIHKDYSYLVKDRPSLPLDKVFKIDDKYFSKTMDEKIELIQNETLKLGAKANLITTLDDIAYVLNIRGNDINCNPVFYSYLYLSKDYGNHLFIDKRKIDIKLNNVEIHDYSEVFDFIKSKKDVPTLLDADKVSAYIYSLFEKPVNGKNPSYLMKAIKGDVEIKNIKEIQAIDGVALLKFQKFLEENIDRNLNEYEYSEQLRKYRYQSPRLFELSFETIAAVGKNAAQMHYGPSKEVSSVVSKNDIELLVDSGGQYYGGTTDTTRTFLIGTPTKEYIKDYTLTLKAVINLSKTIFIDGCSGQSIDIRARQYMWDEGMDYKCGTGHGVSYMLNVHEGPNGFRYKKVASRDDQANIVPGMVTTIEPGVYKEGKYGIRIENNLLCVPAFINDMGVFYKFETITYVPITTESLDLNLMTDDEIEFLNNYHKMVYEKLSPLIDDKDLLDFLVKKTKSISR